MGVFASGVDAVVSAMSTRTRLERAELRTAAAAALAAGQPQRQAAAALGVPRTTLQDWQQAETAVAMPAMLTAFMATPAGVQWLHQLVMAAHWVITLRAGGGVRLVCEWLELSGLSAYVGASYGSQHLLNARLEAAVVASAAEQRAHLAQGMTPRTVTVCEDETFHPEICLVALEPVSNFIVVEQYAADRTAETWTAALAAGLDGLAVDVIQGTGDEAKALRRHIEVDAGAHHSPDLFHLQQEIAQATGWPLQRQLKQAAARLAEAKAAWDAVRARERAAHAVPRRGRPPDWTRRTNAALNAVAAAELAYESAQEQQAEAGTLMRMIGELYHPFDLVQGAAQSPADLAERFAALWQRLERLAEVAALPAAARERLAKAQRLTARLLATMAFFFTSIQRRIDTLNLPPHLEQAVLEHLIPALYLERVAARSTLAEPRKRLRALSADLLAPLRQRTHPLQTLDTALRDDIERVAQDCADLFQRSSSAVEGRNGQLALHHHGRHRLTNSKLAALTAIHNFHLRRPDGRTAAERFFGRAHPPLFEQVLARVPLPPTPRKRRPRPPQPSALTPLAA